MKNAILITVVLIAAALAAWRFTISKPDEIYPDTPESETVWICERCDEVHNLTAAELDQWKKTRMRPIEPMSGQVQAFRCDKCGDFTIVRAVRSSDGGIFYPEVHADGTPGVDPADQNGGG